jgi:hypothetical protein
MSELLNQLKTLIEGQSKALKALIEEYGGVSNFLEEVKKRGIPEKAKAWVEDGKKFVLSQDQVKKLLGDERIKKVAEKLKTTPDQLATLLGEALPPILEKIELGWKRLRNLSPRTVSSAESSRRSRACSAARKTTLRRPELDHFAPPVLTEP